MSFHQSLHFVTAVNEVVLCFFLFLCLIYLWRSCCWILCLVCHPKTCEPCSTIKWEVTSAQGSCLKFALYPSDALCPLISWFLVYGNFLFCRTNMIILSLMVIYYLGELRRRKTIMVATPYITHLWSFSNFSNNYCFFSLVLRRSKFKLETSLKGEGGGGGQ